MEDSDRVERAGKSSQRQQEPLQLCVRQEVDMRIKLALLHSLLSRDSDAETYLHKSQALLLAGRHALSKKSQAETCRFSVCALCILWDTCSHHETNGVHANVNCIPQGGCDPGVFLDLHSAA